MASDLTNVLLVEDDKDDQAAFLDLVKHQKLHYKPVIAKSFNETQNLLKTQSFDVIICDYYLGNYNAFDILKLVHNNTPFIIITGVGDEDIAVRAMREGASDYLIKDIEHNYFKILPLTVDKALKKKRLEDELKSLAKFPEEDPFPVLRISFEGKILFANNSAKTFLLKPFNIETGDPLPPILLNTFKYSIANKCEKEIEIQCEKKFFSLVFVPVKNTKYLNIYGKDITDKKAVEDELVKLSLVASKTNNLVIIADENCKIIWANDAFTKITGYSSEEIIGTTGDILRGSNEQKKIEVQNLIKECINSKTSVIYEIENYTKKGEKYWVVTNLTPIFDENGKFRYFIAIDFDITEVKKNEKKLKDYALELERSNQELDDFASIASHDLKEPLRKLKVYSSSLIGKYKDSMDEEGKSYLTRVKESSDRMQTLIDDLLKYSRINTKAQPFEKTDLKEVVNTVLKDLELQIHETKGNFDIDSLPVIEAEKVQMHQLFKNLLNNALKFHKPSVPPFVGITVKDLNKNTLEITIKDNGIGFNEKYVDKIFKPFQRLVAKSDYEGSGIGLAICHKIVKRHGGEINAFSKQNEGSQFIFTLPIVQKKSNKNN